MCGIVGLISTKPLNKKDFFRQELAKMTAAIAHRGNSDSRFFEEEQCLFGHKRLSIIDLTEVSLQPIVSKCGRYVCVFNGEIYNYLELAKELLEIGLPITGKSDTEVVLYSYITWDKDCLKKFRGMFAFAIWDLAEKKLFAARDHLGIKPFYWFLGDVLGQKCFVFASEIKAFLKTSFFQRRVNKEALSQYLQFYSINPPDTMLEGLYALRPGHYLEFSEDNLIMHAYWNLCSITTNNSYNSQDLRIQVRDMLEESVKLHMRADVQVGAFLSGGLDSTVIVGIMSSLTSKPINTFSIGFEEQGGCRNELQLAELVARRFGCDHTSVVVTGELFMKNFEKFVLAIDQPSGDGINSFLVSQVAGAKVTVAMSGLGGDEIFLGYRYFQDFSKLLHLQKSFVFRKMLPSLSNLYKYSRFFRAFAWKNKLDFLKYWPSSEIDSYFKMRTLFSQDDINLLLKHKSVFKKEAGLFLNGFNMEDDVLNKLSKLELSWYTPGMLLRDTDVTSMVHTLEVRVPFLDVPLVELLLSIPSKYKVSHDQKSNKPLLVSAFKDLIPEELIKIPKQGFEMPLGFWLKKFFRSELQALAEVSWLNKHYVLKLLEDFDKDPRNYLKLWTLLVLCKWVELYDIEGLDEEDFIHTSWTGDRRSASKPSLFN